MSDQIYTVEIPKNDKSMRSILDLAIQKLKFSHLKISTKIFIII